jgi:hypothetical protein
MWLGTSSIKGLSSPDTFTHLSAIVEGVSRSRGESGSAPASSYYSYNRHGKQIVHLASSCYYTHTTHATGKTHRSYTSLSSYYYLMCPHTKNYVLILLCVFSYYYMCAHTTHTKARLTDTTPHCPHTNYIFVLILLCMCPQQRVLLRLLRLLRCHCTNAICVLSIYLPHTAIYLSVSYYFVCVLRQLYIHRSHTTIYVSPYY